MPFATNCPKCGKGLQVPDAAVGKRVKCPTCAHVWQVAGPTAAAGPASPAPSPQKTATAMTKCPGCGKDIQIPDSMAGKRVKCPACAHIWQVPGPVVDAEEVPEFPTLESRFDEMMSDSYPLATDFGRAGGPAGQPVTPAEPARRPCPMCGEMIVVGAAKCRYCDAIFDETLKRATKKKTRGGGSSDDHSLSAVDWVLCLIPLNIACFVAIYYMIKGKPKGLKMIGIALAFQLIEGFLYGVIMGALRGHH
jgi:hypothetical protein